MPNLEELINIHWQYPETRNKLSRIKRKKLTQVMSEGFDQNFIDNFDIFSEMMPYFTGEKKAYVVLLFIDIVSFSKKKNLTNPKKLKTYLDEYYDMVIPIIHSYGGVIDKIMGDGVICVFGEPFLTGNLETFLKEAENCSIEILKEFDGSDYESKIAIHTGKIMYYQNQTNYKEFTMIGTPITELYRLESVSENNAINYYPESDFDKKIRLPRKSPNTNINYGKVTRFLNEINPPKWKNKNIKAVTLEGVEYNHIKYSYPI